MKRSLIILVFTRTGWDFKNVTALLPLSVLYLVRPLRRLGFDVVLLDQRLDEQWERKLRELSPRALLVGISAMTGVQIAWGLKAAALVRSAAPETPIVWGGIHPTLLPQQTAAHPLVDIVVRGEGETTLPRLAQTIREGGDLREVPGLTLVRSGEVQATPAPPLMTDMDEALAPDYEAINVEDYVTTQTLGLRDLAITTSRGCPNGCRYCYNLPFNQRRWRGQSAAAVVEHVKTLVTRFGLQGILIKDDNFYADRRRVEDIAEGLQREKLQVTIRGECRADYISRRWDEPFFKFLYDAGFREMTVGAESGDDRTLAHLGKDLTVADIREANQRLRRAAIAVKFTFMTGFPSEDLSAIRRTIALMLELLETNPLARVTPLHLYAPYPGTPMFEEAVTCGYQPPADLSQWSEVSFHNPNLPWLNQAWKKRLKRASVATYLLDGRTAAEYFTGHPAVQTLVRWYGGIIRWRCRHMFFELMPETAIIDWYRKRK